MIRAAEHTREPAIGRRLGPLEWLVYRLDRVSRLNCVVHAEVTGPLTPDTLRAGLNAVQRRHPLAHVRIVRDGRRAARFVVGVPEIPLRIADVPADAWVEQLEREVHTALPVEQGPLLRAVWLRHPTGKATVLLTYHHAIGDGLSGVYLLRDLVQGVAAACEGYDVTLPVLPSLPSVQERFPAAARGARAWWRYVRLIVRILRDVRRYGMPELFVPDATVPLAECRMRTRPYRFERAFTRALVARSRAEEATVSGAMIAALARAAAGEDAPSRAKRLLFGVPINIRRHVTPPVGQDCGVFATGVTVCATLAPGGKFWDLARQIARDIRSHIDAGDHLILVPRAWQAYSMLMPGVQPDEDGMARFAAYVERRPPPNAPFSLTNLGRLAVDSTFGPLHIQAMGLLVGVSALSRLVATVVTLDDVMVFHVAGLAPLISDDRLGRIADRAVAELHAAVGV